MLSDAWFRDLKIKSWGLKSNSDIIVRNYFFLKNYVTSEGAISHNVLYYNQQLSIAGNQVSFYSNNYFEWLPIVSTAIKQESKYFESDTYQIPVWQMSFKSFSQGGSKYEQLIC